jgi:hypothetical protein
MPLTADATRQWRQPTRAFGMVVDEIELAALEKHYLGCPECAERAEAVADSKSVPRPTGSGARRDSVRPHAGTEQGARSWRDRW